MTTTVLPSRASTSGPSDPAHDLMEAVAAALGDVVRASLDHDRDAARRVLRDGARRHALVAAAEQRARREVVGSAVRRRAATHELLLVADVARASRLVDHLARLVLLGRGGHERLGVTHTEALVLLARFGSERLHQLAEGPRGPGLDREFVRCGRCLVDAADRLDHAVPGRRTDDPAVACCAALAHAVLQASRHALHAAAA